MSGTLAYSLVSLQNKRETSFQTQCGNVIHPLRFKAGLHPSPQSWLLQFTQAEALFNWTQSFSLLFSTWRNNKIGEYDL